ncbi:MAG: hypothetical protein EBY18_23280 [Alphaproteobacteria bacterium]|nr:hypothetical protein [Alphaproteobacteria bacterium]
MQAAHAVEEIIEGPRDEALQPAPCLILAPSKEEARALAGKPCARRSVRRGEMLFEAGRTFSAMYVVWSGRFLVETTNPDGSFGSVLSFVGGVVPE